MYLCGPLVLLVLLGKLVFRTGRPVNQKIKICSFWKVYFEAWYLRLGMIFNFKVSAISSNIFILKRALNYKILLHWGKFNRG